MSPDPVVERLRRAGCVWAEDEAALLVGAATGPAHLDELVARRVAGEPLEVLLGWARVGDVRVDVDPGLFVPRQRTALLIAEASRLAPPGGRVLDLCCGTGVVAAGLPSGLEVHAADVDPAAVACARRNLPGAQVWEGDLFDALPRTLLGGFDVVVANAPYVPTDELRLMPPEARLHEPAVALDGGAGGVAVHRRICAGVGRWLRPGGHLLIEAGSGQAVVTAQLMRDAGLVPQVVSDDELGATVVIGA